jgi:hypothetical protein
MIFVLTLAVSVAVAPAYYFMRGAQGEPGMQLVALVLVLAGPLVMTVLVSVAFACIHWLRRR